MEAISWGGSEELWSQAAMLFRNKNATVHVNVRKWNTESNIIKRLESVGCKVTRRNATGLVAKAVRNIVGNGFYGWLKTVGNSPVIISQGNNFDGVHWANACERYRKPYILISHAASEFMWPADDEIKLARRAYRNSGMSFFVSERNLELTSCQLGVSLEHAKVLRNPFKVKYDLDLAWPSDCQTLSLACVGRLDPKTKGQDLLLQVFSKDKWRKRNISLTMYGSGPNEITLQELARKWGLKNVSFGGFSENIEKLWQAHHALVLPSRMEGLPIAIVEAMLCRRPCLVTDVAGNAELIQDNITGFVASAPTLVALDEALERLWLRREELQSIGVRAGDCVRQQVPQNPVEQFVDQVADICQE
jgi:glycosyltransferase involved in cell wall biosynthesis